MDATAMALKQPFPSASLKELRNSSGFVCVDRRKPSVEILSSGFCDQGHLLYYSNSNYARRMSVVSGKKEKSCEEKTQKKMKTKKQMKLLKGLSRDLSTFSHMGFGLDCDAALLDQVKGNMISEAAELLLEQLQKVRADEKELKRKMKEEKARLKAAARMQNNVIDCEMSSSSSSSESSDSECGGEVVDMNKLKRPESTQLVLQQVIEDANQTPTIPAISSSQQTLSDTIPAPVLPSPTTPTLQLSSSCNLDNVVEEVSVAPRKKIEVCMGGKCKKSGAGALLEEFQRAVGVEGEVCGCKCMGKCKEGPNVKVLNGFEDAVCADNSVKASANSLCIGVGLEDVNVIVANFVGGESRKQLAFAAA